MRRKQSERAEQRQIVSFLRQLGATVYVLGTTRRRGDHQGTMQTPGLPDLLAFVPYEHGVTRRGETLLAVEVKSAVGRLSQAQIEFQTHCHDAGIEWVSGTFDRVVEWAESTGRLTVNDRNEWVIPRAQRGEVGVIDHVHDCTGADMTCACGYRFSVPPVCASIEITDGERVAIRVVSDVFNCDDVETAIRILKRKLEAVSP